MRTLLLVLASLAAACRGPTTGRGGADVCTRLRAERQLRQVAFCEDVWSCGRPPGGAFDRVGLRRIARCDGARGPVVLYLPGAHMNAELPATNPATDFRLFLAEAGFRVWGLDYRTHAVPADASPEELNALTGWTAELFADDAAWAIGFVRGGDAGSLFLAGFSYGAGLAYRLVARGVPIDGLVILDGSAPAGAVAAPGPAALDVGSSRLPFETRQELLERVRRAPEGRSSAGETLAEILYTAQSFGSRGGLSNAKGGVSDVRVVAQLLATYDRWWPRAATGGGPVAPPPTPVPVLAFAGAQMGDAWVERVRASATTFGGPQTEVRVLPGHGHLDVLVGAQAARTVYEPARAWMSGAGR